MIPERESEALRAELVGWERPKSSGLARTEVVRAAALVSEEAREAALSLVKALDLISVGAEILDEAARLRPLALRSLDAIHLATALAVGEVLGAFVTYDAWLADAARGAGLAVLSPA